MGSSPFSFPLPKYLGSVFGLEEEASRRIKQGKEGVESGYLVPDLVPALWEASWCHISQPPTNNTGSQAPCLGAYSLMADTLSPKCPLASGQDSQESQRIL